MPIKKSQKSEKDNLTNSSQEVVAKETTSAFLLAEYERLKDLRNELSQRASRRFEFFLTIASAAVGAYLIILNQSQGIPVFPRYIMDIFAVLFLGYGLITFMNITFASTFEIEIVRAVKRIQQYFITLDPTTERYLYFNSPYSHPNNYRLIGVLARGVGGGSEKSVIAFINSSLITYILISLLKNYFRIQVKENKLIIAGIVVFIISAFFHALYVTLMYKYSRATRQMQLSVDKLMDEKKAG